MKLLLRRLSYILIVASTAFGQVENVPVSNPVYDFLKRMEIRGVLERYHDNILPLSRSDVAEHLKSVRKQSSRLSGVETSILEDLETEFQLELFGDTPRTYELFDNGIPSAGRAIGGLLSDDEKHVYAYRDTNVTFFMDGLLTIDARRSTGDALGGKNAAFAQFGARIRGTVGENIGVYFQGTNAQFWGTRSVLERDRQISQAYTLRVMDAQNFDVVEGYARYSAGILSLQVGRERLLWGNGYGDQLILSANPRMFDFVRADAQYKSLKYTFLHGWLLGSKTTLAVRHPEDSLSVDQEPIVSDKFVGAHRIEWSAGSSIDLGFQEIAIYSNRSVDLAYLNPITLIESAQRAREERDNVLWAFDAQARPLRNVEIHGTLFLDDLHFGKIFSSAWQNRYALQAGVMVADPLSLRNLSLFAEYTRIEPFTFSHGRSRDNQYTSLDRPLGHHIGPNADSWYLRADFSPSRRIRWKVAFELQREGENQFDARGKLIRNVGGDVNVWHRRTDPADKEFLGGDLLTRKRFSSFLTFEPVNEIFLDLRYELTTRRIVPPDATSTDHDFGMALRVDF